MIAIVVRSKTKNLESKIRRYTERRIGFALDHLRDLRRIVVSIEDVNGPKGGPDKRCHIIAEFGFSSISLEETQSDWQTAIARAIHRLDRTATNRLHRANRSRSRRMFSNASRSRNRSMSGNEAICSDRRHGRSLRQIARNHRISTATVRRVLIQEHAPDQQKEVA